MSKRDFLDSVRVARNLYEHAPVSADGHPLNGSSWDETRSRSAIWLAPSSVKGFEPEDFKELGPEQQQALTDAVQQFKHIATEASVYGPATEEQYRRGGDALEAICQILDDYLPNYEEAAQIGHALESVDFPPWVLNWDFEIGVDHDDDPSLWVTLFADETTIRPGKLGKYALEMIARIHSVLEARGIRRRPYIRMRTAAEYKAG